MESQGGDFPYSSSFQADEKVDIWYFVENRSSHLREQKNLCRAQRMLLTPVQLVGKFQTRKNESNQNDQSRQGKASS